jgi:hypothetical protein
MAITDAERLQAAAVALMRYNVLGGGGAEVFFKIYFVDVLYGIPELIE